MIISRVTSNTASGEVQSGIKAMINLNEFRDYFSIKIVRTTMQLLPKRGDKVAGYITRINNEERFVTLDVIRYMEDIRASTTPSIAPGDTPISQPILMRRKINPIRSILIIDHDTGLTESIQNGLDHEGYDVSIATGETASEQTLAILEKYSVDACLLDVNLPTVKQGAELSQRISNDFPGIKIILTTAGDGFPADFSGVLFENTLCVDFIKKPFKMDELIDILTEAEQRDPVHVNRLFHDAPAERASEHVEIGGTIETELQREILSLQKKTSAQAVALFEIHPVTMEVQMPASIGIDQHIYHTCQHRLSMSPVRDCAIDKEIILSYDVNNPREIGKHRNLKKLFNYLRCVGIPVNVHGEVARCIFVFSVAAFKDQSVRFMVEASAARLEKIYTEYNFRYQAYRQKMEATAGITYAILGHELKNKLTILSSTMRALGSATECRETLMADENINRIKTAGELVNRLQTITSVFKKLAEKQKSECVDIYSTLNKSRQDIVSYAHSEGIKINLSIDDSMKLPSVQANEWAIVQVFFNVILNAVQNSILFRNDIVPFINIKAGIKSEGKHLSVEISDKGPGIHAVDFEKIFEPLETPRPDGAGLGLHLCRCVINEIKGKIYVKESILYCGSIFEIVIPFK
jgi:signal transduction histidine kinase/DNA-binding response OmpR family regulator